MNQLIQGMLTGLGFSAFALALSIVLATVICASQVGCTF